MNFVVRNCSERMLKILKKVCDQKKISLATDNLPQYYIDSLKQLSLPRSSAKDDSDQISEQPLTFQRHTTFTAKTSKLIEDEFRT